MLKLRIKIDVWSEGFGEALRQTIRDRLLDVYQQLPRRRLWLFLKKQRFMEFCNKGGENDAYLNEPEDAVARGRMCPSFHCFIVIVTNSINLSISQRRD